MALGRDEEFGTSVVSLVWATLSVRPENNGENNGVVRNGVLSCHRSQAWVAHRTAGMFNEVCVGLEIIQ